MRVSNELRRVISSWGLQTNINQIFCGKCHGLTAAGDTLELVLMFSQEFILKEIIRYSRNRISSKRAFRLSKKSLGIVNCNLKITRLLYSDHAMSNSEIEIVHLSLTIPSFYFHKNINPYWTLGKQILIFKMSWNKITRFNFRILLYRELSILFFGEVILCMSNLFWRIETFSIPNFILIWFLLLVTNIRLNFYFFEPTICIFISTIGNYDQLQW